MLTAFGLAGACATEPPPPPPPPIVEPITFMVFFDWDSTKLSDVALRTIGQATGFVAERIDKPDFELVVTGYADTSGTPQYNMALSLRRANAVKDALVRDGVPARMIRVIGRGEEGLLVATADGVREPQRPTQPGLQAAAGKRRSHLLPQARLRLLCCHRPPQGLVVAKPRYRRQAHGVP